MTGAHVRLLAALLVLAAGCDGVAKSGETIVADNGGTIWGFNNPNAVRVEPGGTLVVANANLFGLGKLIDTFPMGAFPTPGPAIQSDGGTVRIENGRIAAGNILVQIDPSTIPVPPPGTDPFFDRFGFPRQSISSLSPALAATDSVVQIDGGTLVSSSLVGQPNPYVTVGATVDVIGGQLTIRGGELLQGTIKPAAPIGLVGRSLLAFFADVEISNGTFEGLAQLGGSRATVTGGRFAAGIQILAFVPLISGLVLPPNRAACYEIRGGTIPTLSVSGSDPIFIFGSQFDQPLGRVTLVPPLISGLPSSAVVNGILADGTPLHLDVSASETAQITLVAPGGAGCAP